MLGSEWEEQGSEPGPRQLRLGVLQSDEPVGLPPARQQSPVRGGVKCPMCGFPCKQYLELQRKARVRCRESGGSHTPLAVAAELRADVWLYCSLIPLSPETARKPEQVGRQQALLQSKANAKWKTRQTVWDAMLKTSPKTQSENPKRWKLGGKKIKKI